MRVPDELISGCPPHIRAWLEKRLTREWTQAQLEYAIAHDTARHYRHMSKPPPPIDVRHIPRWQHVYSQRLRQLVHAAVTLRMGDPSIPEAEREARSEADRQLASQIEDFGVQQFDVYDWSDVLEGREPRSMEPAQRGRSA